MVVNTENKPSEILENILKQYGAEDTILFRLRYKYMLHIDLSEKYPYLEDESDRNGYIAFWNEWNRRIGYEKGISD